MRESQKIYYLRLKKVKINLNQTFVYEFETIFKQNNGRYGYPGIQIILANKSINASYAKVYRYMKLLNLYSNITIKKFVKNQKNIKIWIKSLKYRKSQMK